MLWQLKEMNTIFLKKVKKWKELYFISLFIQETFIKYL